MLGYITKDQYFSWVEQYASMRTGYASASVHNLKDIQDHYALSRLSRPEKLRVLEVGGGDCRVLRGFSAHHECWNAERFLGDGLGPKQEIRLPGIRNVLVHLGEFSDQLPANYFDIVFSISVVEHIGNDNLSGFFRDVARVMKPGALTFHAIDLYVFDQERLHESVAKYSAERLKRYLQVPELTHGSLSFTQKPQVSPLPLFSCAYATNSDREMLAWNRYAPQLKAIRCIAQSVSLAGEWLKA